VLLSCVLRLSLKVSAVAAGRFEMFAGLAEEHCSRAVVVAAGVVDGTFIWIPSHDQRPHSLSTALLRSWLPSLPAWDRGSGGARSEVSTTTWTVGGQWNCLETATSVTEGG
jgi:hypothetical protein